MAGLVRITKSCGSYDWAHPRAKQWVVCMSLPPDAPEPSLKTSWSEADEPDVDGQPPSEVIELMAQRVRQVVSSDREEKQQAIAWVRANAERLDAMWAEGEINRLEGRREQLAHEIKDLRQYLQGSS